MSFVTLLIFSCSKTKESKRWKAYEGIYTSSQVNYQIMDSIYINEIDVSESLEIRPVVFLKSRMLLLGGKGTFEEPYIVK